MRHEILGIKLVDLLFSILSTSHVVFNVSKLKRCYFRNLLTAVNSTNSRRIFMLQFGARYFVNSTVI